MIKERKELVQIRYGVDHFFWKGDKARDGYCSFSNFHRRFFQKMRLVPRTC